jgi:hypothetical protein
MKCRVVDSSSGCWDVYVSVGLESEERERTNWIEQGGVW